MFVQMLSTTGGGRVINTNILLVDLQLENADAGYVTVNFIDRLFVGETDLNLG